MVRRTFTIAFMAGAHVFPGGRVDDGDAHVDASWCDGLVADAETREPAAAFAVSAARELFEEAGVALARTPDGALVSLAGNDARRIVEAGREAVHAKTRTFRDVIEREGWRLALDALVPFAHWVTPPNEVRRFDTWFFMAQAPGGQEAAHDAHESDRSVWLRPADALAACLRGDINLPPPTWATLHELCAFRTVADALSWAAGVAVVERAPVLTGEGDARQILMPGHPDHPSTERVVFESRFVWTGGRWLPG